MTESAPEPSLPICKVKGCTREVLSEKPLHRKLCAHHFDTYPDKRPKCKTCSRYAAPPYADLMCEHCHPSYRELTPYESQVLEAVRRGENPVQSLVAQNPELTQAQAAVETRKAKRSPRVAAAMRRKLAEAGIDDAYRLEQLKANIEAKKTVYWKGQPVAEERDTRASNTALDIAFKLAGEYPSKPKAEPPKQEIKIAVAMLPAEIPRSPDTPVYTLPAIDAEPDEDEG